MPPSLSRAGAVENGDPPPPEEEEEPTDLVAFQSSLDDSVNVVRALVESWIPKDLDASWNTPAGAGDSFANFSLTSRARPARLGLGASASALHLQQAEEKKLRDRLLPSASRKRGAAAMREEEERNANAVARRNEEEGDEEDEEESRSKAIRRKANGAQAFGNGISTARSAGKQAGAKTHGCEDEDDISSLATPMKGRLPLLDPASSAIASPLDQPTSDTSATPSRVQAAEDVVTSLSRGDRAPPVKQLSKNRRKKERERLAVERAKEARLEEVRREDEERETKGKGKGKGKQSTADGIGRRMSGDSRTSSDDDSGPSEEVSTSTPLLSKQHRLVKPPFAPLQSPSIMSNGDDLPAAGTGKPVDMADDDDDEDHASEGETESVRDSVNGSLIAQNGDGDGEGGGKKKKRKRRKKKSSGGAGQGVAAPVLDLRIQAI